MINLTTFTEAADIVRAGRIAVIPTDTLYGVVADARNEAAVECVYKLKRRNRDKPLIVLIADTDDLNSLGIKTSNKQQEFLARIWPAPVSVILPCNRLPHVHRGTKTLAVRVPDKPKLREFLRKTGPIVAPSANPEERPPAHTIAESCDYFGDEIVYVDGSTLSGEPSTLISFTDEKLKIVRSGAIASEKISAVWNAVITE